MQYRLDLVLTPAEGALLRVIGMAERRGFAPRAIAGAPNAADDGRWHLQLVVDSTRPPETLRRQIEKIYDCVSVRISALDRRREYPHDCPHRHAGAGTEASSRRVPAEPRRHAGSPPRPGGRRCTPGDAFPLRAPACHGAQPEPACPLAAPRRNRM